MKFYTPIIGIIFLLLAWVSKLPTPLITMIQANCLFMCIEQGSTHKMATIAFKVNMMGDVVICPN